MKNENGITLISLVVTIVIMLILTTVSIGTAKTGLIDKAKQAKYKAEQTLVKEKIDIAVSECELEYFESANEIDILEYLYLNLKNYLNEFTNMNFTLNPENILLTFEYNNSEYSFVVSPNGISTAGKKLLGNVKVGEFINYPVGYVDTISGAEFNANNGWCVIDDGVMNGTSGNVKIMSYGIPGKWICQNYDEKTVSILISNFKNEKIICFDGNKRNIGEMFNENLATNISPLTLKELNYAYNKLYKTSRAEDDKLSEISNGNDMFCNQLASMYWLIDNDKLLKVASKNIIDRDSFIDIRNGMKIVITLKKDLSGNFEDGVWRINN